MKSDIPNIGRIIREISKKTIYGCLVRTGKVLQLEILTPEERTSLLKFQAELDEELERVEWSYQKFEKDAQHFRMM